MCHHSDCSCYGLDSEISRRGFLVAAAGTTMAGGFLLRAATAAEAAQTVQPEPQSEWPDVCVAYVRPKEKYWLGWPGTAWEVNRYEDFMTESRSLLEQFGRELKVRVNFEPEPLYDPAAVDKFVAKIKATKPKGVVLFPLHMNQWGQVDKIAHAGAPTIIFAGLGVCFTGHIQNISRLPGVYLASSPDFELNPVRYGLKMIRTAHDIRRMRIAVLAGDETKDEVLEPFGLKIRRLPRQRFIDTLKTIGETPEVVAVAEEYQKAAQKVVEPSRTDLINASRNYFTSLKILEEEDCNGITMDCLGAVSQRQIPCPPCMAWSKLLDVGIPAICEADINAVMSNTLCCKLLDKPGFMQDPVPETVHNTFIGAHCVCPTRLNGYDQPREPFILRSHAESDIGVSLQVLWRPEQEVTIMQCDGPGKMILGKGKVLRNFDTPPAGGCRTSVELAIDAPPDTRDTKGFHQLFIYGDHVRDFQAYGQMYGIATEHV
ncbi:MAG TPA: hypothetical protein VM487_17070 [Phycisphaerae bacterium]|nr:hypothetical protein [Phycisphaerae bacterium]